MSITTAMCTSFKEESWQDLHHLGDASASPIGGDVFKIALILLSLSSPQNTYGAASTNYSDITGNADEASDSNSPTSYTAGGATLTNIGVAVSGTTVYADFADVTFSSVTMSADGAMIYNSTNGNRACSLHDFSGLRTASGGDFVLQFPTADASNAILRLA